MRFRLPGCGDAATRRVRRPVCSARALGLYPPGRREAAGLWPVTQVPCPYLPPRALASSDSGCRWLCRVLGKRLESGAQQAWLW